MKQVINTLLSVQTIDIRLHQINQDLDFLPQELQRLDEEVQKLEAEQAQVDKKLGKLNQRIQSLQADQKETEQVLIQLQKQMNSSKSKSEYTGVRNEMENRRRDYKKVDEELLELMLQQEELQQTAETHRKSLTEKTQERNDFKKESEDRISGLQAEREKLEAEKQQILVDIPDEEKDIYNRVAISRGDALAAISQEGNKFYCSACRMLLPFNIANQVMVMRKLIQCQGCHRILYSPERLK